MIIYNVTVNVDYEVHDDWLKWMREVHVPDVLNTGFFIDAKINRILAEEEGGKSYAIQYSCKDMQTLEKYQQELAPKLQQEHTERYAGKFVAFRTLLSVVEAFEPQHNE